ncbi:MAG: hypothetical protein JXR76_06420 [Deltaproteobacteria bacterium]|nr:hypothetical protein [Deltaproteobacteria bacterium]
MIKKQFSTNFITIFLAISLITPSAFAAKIFLNGVDITDVKNKTFNKVKSVHLDSNGDVYIDAPHYEVKVLETGGEGSSENTGAKTSASGTGNPSNLSKRFYVASQGPAPLVQYKLTISINGHVRVTIGANESTAVEEITGWLKQGKNVIHVTAVKELGITGRTSKSKKDELSLLIGSGHEEKKVIKIDSINATFKCNASTTNTFTKEYTIYAQ